MINSPDFLVDETIQLLRSTVQQFALREIAPLAEKIDKDNLFPRQLWPKMGELGLLGMTVDEEFGGAKLGYLAQAIAMEEISRVSAAIGLSYGAHSNLCVNQLSRWGTQKQKQKFLPKLLTGEHVGALAMSETGSGSDVMSMQLRATQNDSGFLLNGTKMWVTNGPEADIIIVYANTDWQANSRCITAFIIETDRPGFSTAQKLDKLGMRGSDTCELVFKNYQVKQESILGQVNEGKEVLMSGLDYERLILAAGPVGIMQACLDVVLPYIHDRKQFGKSLGEFQLIQAKVADIYTKLNSSRAYLYSLAQTCDYKGSIRSKDAASIILYTAESAMEVTLQAIQCLGGNGYINDFPVGRYLRDAKLYEIGAGTSEIRRLIIGRELFRESE